MDKESRLFTTMELIETSRLEREKITYLRKLRLISPVSKEPLLWSYESVLLCLFMSTIGAYIPKYQVTKFVKDLLAKDGGLKDIFTEPYIIFSIVDKRIMAFKLNNELGDNFKLNTYFTDKQSNIIQVETLALELPYPLNELILKNVWVVDIARLKLKIDMTEEPVTFYSLKEVDSELHITKKLSKAVTAPH